jgi:hypothetical protein
MNPDNRKATFGGTYLQSLKQPLLYPPQTAEQKMWRRATGYRGEGDYKDILKWGSRGIGALAGGAMGLMSGGVVGAATGAQSGFDSGAKFSKWAGWGDYGPAVHNQIAGGEGSAITVNASDDMTGDVYLSHKEYVGNVICSATAAGASLFQQTNYALNPGLSATFPFLSQIASNFELYDFQGLMFEYRPTSGENAGTSNALGKVIMATQYDPDASNFINSVQMQNYDYSASCKPAVAMVHGVETANHQQSMNLLYVRTGTVAKDKMFTDLGYLTVATEGIPFSAAGTQILGELWVTYRIKLSRANLYNSLLGLSINFDSFLYTSSATQMLATPIAHADGVVTRPQNSGLWTFTSVSPISGASSSTTIWGYPSSNLIAGCFKIDIYVHETTPLTAITNTGLSAATTAGFTGLQILGVSYSSGQASSYGAGKTAAETGLYSTFYVSVSNTNGNRPTFIWTSSAALPVLSTNFVCCSATQVPCSIITPGSSISNI